MEVNKVSQTLILSIGTLLVVGCAGSKEPEKKPTETKPVAVIQNSQATVAELKTAGFGTIAIEGKKVYSQNQAIRFNIDTKGKTGYLYIVYLDEKGQTALLYPNPESPLSELNGKYSFPKDFGGMQITATKDCKGCEQERTTVYAILSKNPITDINNLKAKHLMQGKGILVSSSRASNKTSNINIGKIDFFVK